MKVKITKLSKKDAHYRDSKILIGLVGECEITNKRTVRGYKGISFIPDKVPDGWGLPVTHFYAVKFEVLEK